jgi:hypothetical protein
MPDLENADSGTQVSYWIGIDGIDDGSNLDQIVVQAGFDAVKQADGSTTYAAFYEWFPNPATFISATDFTAAAGESKYHDSTTDLDIWIAADKPFSCGNHSRNFWSWYYR